MERMLTAGAGRSIERASPWWQDSRVRALTTLLFLIGFAGAAALGKSLHPSMGIPGSSAVFWLAPLIAGRALVKRDGAGLFMGVGMAAWGVPLGLENTFGYRIALYGITGLVLDMTAWLPGINIRHLLGAVMCGLCAHMVKFAFIVTFAMTSGVARHFLIVGLIQSALLHAVFGVAAGLLAWGLVKAGERAMPDNG